MKRFLSLLVAALALTFTLPQIASAQSGLTSYPLKWNRGISSYGLGVKDSVVISIPGPAAAVDFADTTEWVDLSSWQFNQGYTAQPIVTFTLYGQANTASDSIGYAVQYSDQKDTPSGSGANVFNGYNSATVAYLSLNASTTAGSNLWGKVVAVAPTSSVYVPRYVRLVVLNAEVGGTIGRRYCGVVVTIAGRKG